MIVQAVINEVAGNERRNDHSGNTQSVPFKREAVLVMAGTWDGVPGSHGFRRNNVIKGPGKSVRFKREALVVMAGTWDGVPGSHGSGRNNVIINSPVLIPGN